MSGALLLDAESRPELVIERPRTLTQAVVEQLGEAIVRGEIAPGSRLTEVSLATRLGLSRQTVREALRQLSELGLITITPHRGAVVSELTPERAQEIVTLRALLEGFAGRLVAEQGIDANVIATMERALDAQRRAALAGELLPLIQSDMDFHYRLARQCGHELLVEHLTSLQALTRRLNVSIRHYHAELDEIVNSHLPILEALKDGRPDVVETAIRTHVLASGANLLRLMAEAGGNVEQPRSSAGSYTGDQRLGHGHGTTGEHD